MRNCLPLCPSLLLALACGADPAPTADAMTSAAVDAEATTAADSGADGPPTTDVGADATPASWSLPPQKPQGALAVMTYNVMCSFCVNKAHADWEHKWSARLPWLRDVFKRFDPDLMGLQEMQAHLPTENDVPEVDQLVGPEKLYDYHHYRFKPGDEVPNDYPDATVLWKKARFDKLDQGVVWLSPTPDKPYSIGFVLSQFPRVMVWVKLRDKLRNRDLWFATTHFDNNSPSQEKSATLVLDALGPLAQSAPLILTGDYNSKPDSKAFGLLAAGKPGVSPPWQDTFNLTKSWTAVHNQAAPPGYPTKDRIDHIFVASDTAKFQVAWWGIDLWLYGPKQQAPSDHDGAIVAYVDW
ncbi:MAG: endonuclease/exonuclease/phosphatase family protein [Deltaproteobacteria bacterium]|nr:endonuclease/exonuclease/phosphatase family protein [Deltaproteobacteria bacterium]